VNARKESRRRFSNEAQNKSPNPTKQARTMTEKRCIHCDHCQTIGSPELKIFKGECRHPMVLADGERKEFDCKAARAEGGRCGPAAALYRHGFEFPFGPARVETGEETA
jgi:hypothetical protein